MNHLEKIASAVFARHGVDLSSAERGGGWTNATWLAGGLALRLSTRQGIEDLSREARLAALFPPEAGYPPIIECGETDGYQWSLAKRIPGCSLGDAWPALDWEARAAALAQLWRKAQAVHAVDVAAAAPLARAQPWFNLPTAGDSAAALARLLRQKLFSAAQADVLAQALRRFWAARPAAECVLNHGDLTIDNALWHEGQVVALLDFEFAVLAPLELDLRNLVNAAFDPSDALETLSAADRAGLLRLRQAAAGIARPILSRPGSPDLLLGYSILHALWLLEDWLAHPEGEGPLETWHPYRVLLSLAEGNGGYLAPVFEDLLYTG